MSVDGTQLFEGVIAPAQLSADIHMRANTQFDIGSLVKPLTGAMISKLISDGILAPDMTLGRFFPDLPDPIAALTLHQLLTHSSGLPGAVASDHEPITRQALLARVAAVELEFEPGTAYAYSNTGFSLAAMMAEEATGETYLALMERLVFSPAGMRHTGYETALDPDRMAWAEDGQSLIEVSWGGQDPGWALVGNGGMVSTLRDMIAFGHHLRRGLQDRAGWAQIMVQPYVDEGGAESFYGYGIVLSSTPELGREIWHDGGNRFFMSELRFQLEHDLILVSTTNTPNRLEASAAIDAGVLAAFGLTAPARPEISDVPLDSLPELPEAGIAMAFLDAVSSSRPQDWQAFLSTHASRDFMALAPIEDHLAFFEMAHRDLANVEIMSFEVQGGDIHMVLQSPSFGRVPARIPVTEEDGVKKFNGIDIG